jgi:hypothetical protein
MKSLVTVFAAVTLTGAAAPAFADDDPPAPLCYDAAGAPVFDPVVCEALGRQASGH